MRSDFASQLRLPEELLTRICRPAGFKLFIAGSLSACTPALLNVIVSSDEGAHWASLTGLPDIGNLSLMAVSDALYLFGDKGFVISKDGVNWNSPIQIAYCNGPYDTETKGAFVICNYNAQVFRSVDHGSTWTPVPPHSCANTTQLTVSGGDVLIRNCFELIGAPGHQGFIPHLFRSSDMGNTWERNKSQLFYRDVFIHSFRKARSIPRRINNSRHR
jgi:hypothetical protein